MLHVMPLENHFRIRYIFILYINLFDINFVFIYLLYIIYIYVYLHTHIYIHISIKVRGNAVDRANLTTVKKCRDIWL